MSYYYDGYDPPPEPPCDHRHTSGWFLVSKGWWFDPGGTRFWVEQYEEECSCGQTRFDEMVIEAVEVVDPWDGWEEIHAEN